ncbi:MAG: UvrD-helicase domain-containing protein [Candidatus Caccovivens sp.]
MKIEEQEKILANDKKKMLVSASAGSGKTYIMIKYICKLICEEKIPVQDFLVLTFTKVAATEMKERLQARLKEYGNDEFIVSQIDALPTANISTIHSFCEKMLKKYANLVGLNENFAVADEMLSQKIRNVAFEETLKCWEETDSENYFTLAELFKNDKDKIKNIVFEIEEIVNSVANREEFLEKCQKSGQFEKAENSLFETYKNLLRENIAEVEKLHIFDFELSLKKALEPVLNSQNLREMSEVEFAFPALPKRKEVGDDAVEKLKVLKNSINKTLGKISALNLNDEDNVEFQKNGILEKLLLNLFKTYENKENSIKKAQNLLDFYDLEKYMNILSENENLFAGIKYVFVDEYQDTNKVQERIIKNIAKNSNFVAVGDVKQGIYGFRLASSEIFLKDEKDFANADDSTVNYLQSNFRSNHKILEFVNDIFKVCMTKELTGVDYGETSLLHGVAEFEDDGQKSVTIDIITPDEKVVEPLPDVYSVKNASLVRPQSNMKVLLDIKRRIQEVLNSKIYDKGVFRKCRYSDIAICARKRSGLFEELELFLTKEGVPIISNSRNALTDDPEIKMLVNYLKIALNMDDEVALLSCILSPFCEVSLQEIVDEKGDRNLCEFVKENKKFEKFNKNLEKFRKNCIIYGIKNSFLTLFEDTGYQSYINLRKPKSSIFVEKFLTVIDESGCNFDLPALINYFEKVEIIVSGQNSAVLDAVLLTTIHNTKGLEYPIVFLIGCDQSLSKSRPKSDMEINEEFGLAVKYYDKYENNEVVGVKMRAIQEQKKQKDFVEELMIFYVALTRAKNRLYLFGVYDENCFEKFALKNCDSYFAFIFFALSKAKKEFLINSTYEDEIMQINLIEGIEQTKLSQKENSVFFEIQPKIAEKIEKYLNFSYNFSENQNFKLKESVTNLSKFDQEENLSNFSNENFNFAGAGVEIGNAYHLALKTLDFDKISCLKDLQEQMALNHEIFDGIEHLIDKNVLLRNILLIKTLINGGQIYKETEFIMKEKLSTLLDNCPFDDEILLQGVIDLFAIFDDGIVLIDYKYSNSKSEQYLIDKYLSQLKFYKLALESGYDIKVKEVYLLSLKYNNLIKIDI